MFIEEADPMHNRIKLKNIPRCKLGDEFQIGTVVKRLNTVSGAAEAATFVDSKPAGYISKGSGA